MVLGFTTKTYPQLLKPYLLKFIEAANGDDNDVTVHCSDVGPCMSLLHNAILEMEEDPRISLCMVTWLQVSDIAWLVGQHTFHLV